MTRNKLMRRPADSDGFARAAGGRAFAPGAWGATNEEQQLVQVLQSDRSPAEKDAACARLKRIGTAECVPALGALLVDEQLSHSARYALESLPAPEAGKALSDALAKTSGLTKVGIIGSLGVRGEARAVSGLAGLLADADVTVAAAAAEALSRIGTKEALEALQATPASSPGTVHYARVDALLRCANHLLASGAAARPWRFSNVFTKRSRADQVRVAAYRGMILAAGQDGASLMTSAIAGKSGPAQIAALQLVRETNVPVAISALLKLLPQAEPVVQAALIGALSQRGDVATAPAIAALANSASPEVRLACLKALAILGDASNLPLLAAAAATGNREEQSTARRALVDLRRGNVTETILTHLVAAPPADQVELARALAGRGDRAAVPTLLELAEKGSDSARKAALHALPLLADQPDVVAMVRLVLVANSQAEREDAVEALNLACQRIRSRHGRLGPEPLARELAAGSVEVRTALLRVCCGLPEDWARAALRAAVDDSNPQVHAAGLRVLCDTEDYELLPDLVRVVTASPDEKLRTLAIGACVRLTLPEEAVRRSTTQRLEPLKTILAQPLRPEQKRLVLAGLADIPDAEAFRQIEPCLADAAVQGEAAQAAIKVATGLSTAQARLAVSFVQKALTASPDDVTRKAADAALKQIEDNADFITLWQTSGPYVKAGKDYRALFDIVFPPETNADQGVVWKTCRPGPIRNARALWICSKCSAVNKRWPTLALGSIATQPKPPGSRSVAMTAQKSGLTASWFMPATRGPKPRS